MEKKKGTALYFLAVGVKFCFFHWPKNNFKVIKTAEESKQNEILTS
jgi:hypothetical protein